MNLPDPTPSETVVDDRSLSEELMLRRGDDLERIKKDKERDGLLRDNDKESQLHFLFMWALKISFIIVILMFATLVYHLILPDNFRWLTDTEIEKLKQFLFSGSVGGALATLGKKAIGKMKIMLAN